MRSRRGRSRLRSSCTCGMPSSIPRVRPRTSGGGGGAPAGSLTSVLDEVLCRATLLYCRFGGVRVLSTLTFGSSGLMTTLFPRLSRNRLCTNTVSGGSSSWRYARTSLRVFLLGVGRIEGPALLLSPGVRCIIGYEMRWWEMGKGRDEE